MDIINYLNRHKIIPILKKWKLVSILLGSIDIFAIALAFQCSFYLNYHAEETFFFMQSRALKLFLLVLPVWLVILYLIQVAQKSHELSVTESCSTNTSNPLSSLLFFC
jgi:hypothetical protein